METSRTHSEHYSWHVRWITFPARPPPSYGLYLPELWRVLGPALINCLGFQFLRNETPNFLLNSFLLGIEDLLVDLIMMSGSTLEQQTKLSDANYFSILLSITHSEINITVLHLFISRLPTGHLQVLWLHSHFFKKFYIIEIFVAISKIHFSHLQSQRHSYILNTE